VTALKNISVFLDFVNSFLQKYLKFIFYVLNITIAIEFDNI